MTEGRNAAPAAHVSSTGARARSLDGGMRRLSRRLARARRHAAHMLGAYVLPLGWMAALLAAASLAGFAAAGWHELLAAGVALTTMLLAAVAMSLGNTGFTASLSLTDRRVRVGDRVRVDVEVDNPGRAPTARARGELPIGRIRETFAIPMLAPGQSKHTEVEFTAAARAVLRVGPLTVRKGDPFGLIRREKSLAESITMYIHPAIVRLDALNAGVARDLEGQPSGQIVDDDLDFYGLREYKPGDDLRNVHWLSTARTGTMMIRQFEATRRTDTSLTLDVAPGDYIDEAEFELAVSVHASIGAQCLDQDRPLSVRTGFRFTRPKLPMAFLDECSAIIPDADDDPNLAGRTLRETPDASFYYLTVGSLKDTDSIRRIAMAFPRSATCVVLQVRRGAPRAIRHFPNFALATVGNMGDLPTIMEALS